MKNKISLKIASASKATPPVRAGGLNVNAIIRVNPNNKVRSEANAARQKAYDGLTVGQALEQRIVDARDLKYDSAKNYITFEEPTTKPTTKKSSKTTKQSQRPSA
jgi:hypothetical protein|tara:strand:- start:61 stop:375 length:315 start_codon:yes stop_codon:yes gene_type:complete